MSKTRKSPRKKAMSFGIVPGGYVDTLEQWDGKHLEPFDIPPSKFEIWVTGTDVDGHATPGGPSACAWRIRGGGIDKPEVRRGRQVRSSEKKAYLAAVAGALDRLPTGSSASLCCAEKYIVDAINGDLYKWVAEGVIEDKRYSRVWKHILKAIERITSDRRSIVARQPTDSEDSTIISDLKRQARSQRPKRSNRSRTP